MRVMVTGGDGFIGWPLTLRLSAKGHEVMVIDNAMRRRHAKSLTPIVPLPDRLLRWHELSTKDQIESYDFDVRDSVNLQIKMEEFCPDAVIHLAVQPSAPFSMRDVESAMLTVDNNVMATTSVLTAAAASVDPPHIIHIGTMGVYGYGQVPGMTIPEGYLEVEINGRKQDILHPTSPGSLYHATKVVDQTLFAFFAKNYSLRITDLHQGIVWGTQTPETNEDEALINRFDYCGVFGTVFNRFLVQAACGHPLTVHGTGEQTRAFININDSIACLELALDSPPEKGERPLIMNQMTEVHRIIDLANMVAEMTGADVSLVDNPRKEMKSNELAADNQGLLDLGLKPTLLKNVLAEETFNVAGRFKHLVDHKIIPATVRWT